MVKLASSPQRQVESSNADRLQRKCEACKSLAAKPLTPEENRDARDNSDHHLGGRPDPVVVESQLEKIGKSDQHSHDADTVEPLTTDA